MNQAAHTGGHQRHPQHAQDVGAWAYYVNTVYDWPIRVVKGMVAHPGTTNQVKIAWPTLSNSEYNTLNQMGVISEFCPTKDLV